MEIELQKKWDELRKELNQRFQADMDLKSILFIIGLQELGQQPDKLSKDQKLDVLHIAICVLLEPYGHYEFEGRDKDGWPHWQLKDHLPNLSNQDQEELLKRSILHYWEKIGELD